MVKVKGFTLIELLVVISIIALLMAILLPTLQRVRNQTKAVGCQSNLQQWGLAFLMYTTDNDSKFFDDVGSPCWRKPMYPYYSNWKDILLCPMAMKHDPRVAQEYYLIPSNGSKFHAWEAPGYPFDSGKIPGSYGLNVWVMDFYDGTYDPWPWRTCLVKDAGNVPVFFDCVCLWYAVNLAHWPPPTYDDVESEIAPDMSGVCINRHSAGINHLFMDWSVRKVGLKELWMLKWNRTYDTAGPWTKAGGVKPEDWPEWMQGFKDY